MGFFMIFFCKMLVYSKNVCRFFIIFSTYFKVVSIQHTYNIQ